MRCGTVFSESQLKGMYIEVLILHVRKHFRNWWYSKSNEEIGDIKRYGIPCLHFQPCLDLHSEIVTSEVIEEKEGVEIDKRFSSMTKRPARTELRSGTSTDVEID